MKCRTVFPRGLTTIAGIIATTILLATLPTYGQNIEESSYKEGELIIQLSVGGDTASIAGSFQSFNLRPGKVLSRRLNIWLFEYEPAGMKADDHSLLLANVRDHIDVNLAQFNHYVKLRSTFPDDPQFNLQWALHNTGQSGGTPDADIDAPEAWDITTGGTTALGDEIVVAVIDGGCD